MTVTITMDSPPEQADTSAPSPKHLSHGRHRMLWEAVATLGAWLIGALFFFSAQWTSGFNRVIGNTGVTRLQVYLSEQWFLVLRGARPSGTLPSLPDGEGGPRLHGNPTVLSGAE
jgi:hypothetical protein